MLFRSDYRNPGKWGLVPTAVTMPAGVTFTTISVGAAQTCALSTSGSAYCWGINQVGGIGNGTTISDPYDPSYYMYLTTPTAVTMPAGVTFSDIESGGGFVCALTTSGNAFCWGGGRTTDVSAGGIDNVGQLGNGTTLNSNLPSAVVMQIGRAHV